MRGGSGIQGGWLLSWSHKSHIEVVEVLTVLRDRIFIYFSVILFSFMNLFDMSCLSLIIALLVRTTLALDGIYLFYEWSNSNVSRT